MFCSNEELVEGNYWGDTFWGICNGEGTNWLGILLMAERAYWQKVREFMPNKVT